MSKEIFRKEIDQIMETIAEQWNIIRAYEGKIPLIEMDIFMSNIRKLYDDLYLLDKLNKTPGFDPDKIRSQITREPSIIFETGIKPKTVFEEPQLEEPESKVKEVVPEPEPAADVPEIFHEPAIIAESELKEEEFSTSETKIRSEIEFQVSEPVIPEEFHQQEIPSDTSSAKVQDEPEYKPVEIEIAEPRKPAPTPPTDLFGNPTPTLADKFQAERKSVKDQLTTNGNDNSLGNRMQQSQISDLKAAIGINDKFLFINELFKGDLAGYNRAIENLNNCQSRDEAMKRLHEMRMQFNWSDNSSSFMRLSNFLMRRYVS